jgi:peptide/nickel transport system permease protein
MLVVLLGVTFIAFLAIQLLPGDCLTQVLTTADQETITKIKQELGLDKPLLLQYVRWLLNALKGDFGRSCLGFAPVTQVLFLGAWQWSLLLAGMTLLLTWMIGLPLGISAAVHRDSWRDYTIQALSTLALSVPVFLVALLLLLVLYLTDAEQWGWTIGQVMADRYLGAPWSWAKLGNILLHLALPLFAIVLAQWAGLARHLRSALLDVLNQSYLQAARAKGVSERVLVYKHALRNAIHPLISWMGFWLPSLFESTLAVSIVINYPTVEFYFWNAIKGKDVYTILGGLSLLGLILVVGNLLADLGLAWADPRIRYE